MGSRARSGYPAPLAVTLKDRNVTKLLPIVAIAAAFHCSLAGAAEPYATQVEADALSRKLDIGIPEADVYRLAGRAPDRVAVSSCGKDTKDGAWQCKIVSFKFLHIYFARVDGVWRVTAWQ